MTFNELKTGLAEDITGCIRTLGRDLPEIEGLDKPTQDKLRLAWEQAYDSITTIVRIATAPFYKFPPPRGLSNEPI